MKNSNEENKYLQRLFTSLPDYILQIIQQYSTLDIGTITKSYSNGKVDVVGNRIIAGEKVKYNKVEVIYPGNKKGAFISDCTNCPCLIFTPCTCVPDITSSIVRYGTTSFNKEGIKVLPISNSSSLSSFINIDGAGNINIETPEYQISFEQKSILVNIGQLSFKASKEGIFLNRKTENTGWLFSSLSDEGLSVNKTGKEGQNTSITFNEDGSLQYVYKNKDGESIVSLSIDTEGTLNVKGKEINVDSTDGNINLNGDSKSLVTYDALNSALQSMWSTIAGHTHTVNTTGTPTNHTGTASPSSSFSSSPDISGAEAKTLKTS